MSVSTKLTLLVASGLVVFVVLGAGFVAYEETRFLDRRTSVHSVLLGRVVASMVYQTWEEDGEARARELLEEIDAHEPSIAVRWVRTDRLEASEGERVDHAGFVPAARTTASGRRIVTRATSGEDAALYTYVPIEGTSRVIEIAEPLSVRNDHMSGMLARLAALVLLGVAASLALAFALGRRLVGRPVDHLVHVTERVGAGDLDVRAPSGSRDELGRLGAAMNRMIEDLAEARAHVSQEQEVRRRAEAHLRHAERLATLGQLAAGVAHEIGTPLQGITMRAELVAERFPDDPDTLLHMEKIRANGAKISEIAQNLLRFGRRSEPESADLDLRDVVRDAVELVRAAYRRAAIEVTVPDHPALVRGDRKQLEQVVTNLLVNALHASEGGTGVAVSVLNDGEEVRACVLDRGSGMSKEVVAHLFEPFFTTKPAGEGTGLGLPISYGIVRDHGGRIDVESEVGRGSRFEVVLPRAR